MTLPAATDMVDADPVVGVNGPEDESVEWDAVDWRAAEQDVRRLRQRIFAATRAEDWKRVRNLQKLMLRSRANALISVRRVTEINAGRKTAGVDGQVVVMDAHKAELAEWVQLRARPWSPRPVKRVYVPKSNGRRRPLGIPVIADRCLQALTAAALEPEWEAKFEPKSYGFRPGRGCHDAIVAIHTTASRKDAKRLWVLDADLAAAFDHLDHDHILRSLGTFPARELVRQWLTAGVIEDGRFSPTDEGAPQGGVISPLIMNVALHGMEAAAGVRYYLTGTRAGKTVRGCPVVVRYADDLIALCHSREQAEQVKAQLAEWLAPRGLVFNETKTQITHLQDFSDLTLLSDFLVLSLSGESGFGGAETACDLVERWRVVRRVAGGVELMQLVDRAGEAYLESFDLAEPSFSFGFGDPGGEVVVDLFQALASGGVGS